MHKNARNDHFLTVSTTFLLKQSNPSIASITSITPNLGFPRCIGPKVTPAVLHLRWDKLLRYIAAGPQAGSMAIDMLVEGLLWT